MSFAQEMKDFYTGFRATYGVAADVRDKISEKKNSFDYGKADDDFKMFA